MKNTKVEVRSFLHSKDEKGLFAKSAIKKGEHIFTLEGFKTKEPTRTSIQVGVNEHIDWDNAYFAFFNHSCTPNCAIDVSTLKVYALCDIAKDEELYFNYNSTEYHMAAPFACLCCVTKCVGVVKGYKFLTPEEREAISEYVAPHLVELAKKEN